MLLVCLLQMQFYIFKLKAFRYTTKYATTKHVLKCVVLIFIYLNTAQWCRTNILTLLLVQTKVEELKQKRKAAIYQLQIEESFGSRQSKKKANIEKIQT